MTPKRRKILKASGTGLATTAVPFGVMGRADARAGSETFEGLSYHSFSHEVQDTATATVRTDAKGRLSGTLEAAGFKVPLGGLSPTYDPSGRAVYRGRSTAPEHVDEGKPLTFRLTDHGPFMTGYLSRPTPGDAKVGVTLHPSSSDVSASAIRKALDGDGSGVGRGRIDSTGIPDAVEPEGRR